MSRQRRGGLRNGYDIADGRPDRFGSCRRSHVEISMIWTALLRDRAESGRCNRLHNAAVWGAVGLREVITGGSADDEYNVMLELDSSFQW
jgi:hypothetical protein